MVSQVGGTLNEENGIMIKKCFIVMEAFIFGVFAGIGVMSVSLAMASTFLAAFIAAILVATILSVCHVISANWCIDLERGP